MVLSATLAVLYESTVVRRPAGVKHCALPTCYVLCSLSTISTAEVVHMTYSV